MSTIVVLYNWSVPETFEADFEWRIVTPPPPPKIPTLLTSGPQNAINRPTLVFPNGGENILAREIEVSWIEPSPASSDNLSIWYEIYFTENYDYMTEPDWKMIASVPSGIGKFLWKVGNSIKSKNVRVGVRAVNSRGERSDMSISASSFTIRKSLPVTPAVLSPIPNQKYGTSIKFVFDDTYILNSFAQRAKYYIFFSSAKAQIPFTSIAQKIPVGSGPLVWDTTLIPPSDDYVVTVYLADDDGNKSEEVSIRNLSIVQEGFFLIDTKPPTGYMQINDSEQFTRNENVSIRLYSHDETTGVHSMQFIESKTNGEEVIGSPDSFANIKYWQLTNDDGIKTIKVKFQDYGGNRISEQTRSFRVLFDINNDDVVDMTVQKSNKTVWLAKNGSNPSIYKLSPVNSFVTYVNEDISCISFYGDVLYISVKTSDNTALVYRWTGILLEEAFSLAGIDTEITSMCQFGNKLFLGCKNGDLYVYDESSISFVKSFGSQFERLYSDNSLLYIVLRNSKQVVMYDSNKFTETSI